MTTATEHKKTPRPPVAVVMGHIDHGKTALLDAIRKTNVAGEEAGGITQHIGAYEITHNSQRITFIDTPGHEAFGKMRMRGARVADVAILVIAADEGVKPQTLEALDAIRKADIPFLIALNKIDKPQANAEQVKKELSGHNIYIMSGEFFFYLLGIGLRFINFVQRYKKWDIGFSNSVQRLKRLGFHAFISSDHKNCNISNPGPPHAHFTKCFVPGSVNKCYALTVMGNLVRTNMLSNSAGFFPCNIRFSDCVK